MLAKSSMHVWTKQSTGQLPIRPNDIEGEESEELLINIPSALRTNQTPHRDTHLFCFCSSDPQMFLMQRLQNAPVTDSPRDDNQWTMKRLHAEEQHMEFQSLVDYLFIISSLFLAYPIVLKLNYFLQ